MPGEVSITERTEGLITDARNADLVARAKELQDHLDQALNAKLTAEYNRGYETGYKRAQDDAIRKIKGLSCEGD